MKKEELLKMISDGNSAEAAFSLDELESTKEQDEVRLAIIRDMSFITSWDVMDMEMFMTTCKDLSDTKLCEKSLRSHVIRMYDYSNLQEVANVAIEQIENQKLLMEIFYNMLDLEIDDTDDEAKTDVYTKFIELFEEISNEDVVQQLKDRIELKSGEIL